MSSSSRSSNETLEVTIRLTRAASRRLVATAAQLTPAPEVNIQTQDTYEPEAPPIHRPRTG